MENKPVGTKQRIIQAAKNLFSAYGLSGTTLEDILTASGTTKGAFYHHFKSKESLCHTVIDHAVGEYHELGESVPSDAEPIEKLEDFFSKIVSLNSSGQWVNCRLILKLCGETGEVDPKMSAKIKNFLRWYSDFLQEMIRGCQRTGAISEGASAELLTEILMSVIAGGLTLEKVSPSKVGFDELISGCVSLMQ